jgi:ferrous iron transport protein A
MVLSECEIGKRVKVRALQLPEAHQKRLLDLGLLPGTEVEIVRKAPFGDPVVVRFRGCQISLRSSVLSRIMVEVAR